MNNGRGNRKEVEWVCFSACKISDYSPQSEDVFRKVSNFGTFWRDNFLFFPTVRLNFREFNATTREDYYVPKRIKRQLWTAWSSKSKLDFNLPALSLRQKCSCIRFEMQETQRDPLWIRHMTSWVKQVLIPRHLEQEFSETKSWRGRNHTRGVFGICKSTYIQRWWTSR